MEQQEHPQASPDAPRRGRAGRLRRALWRVPRWVIALALVLLFWGGGLAWQKYSRPVPQLVSTVLGFLTLGAIFTAGAIRRLKWRHALVLLVLSAVAEGLWIFIAQSGIVTYWGYQPYRGLLAGWTALWLLVMGEGLLTRVGPRRVLLWSLPVALSAEAVHQVVTAMLNWTEWSFPLEAAPDTSNTCTVGFLLFWPILAVVAWTALPLAFAALRRGRRGQAWAAGAVATTLALHALFFFHVAFALGRPSIEGRGPFSRNMGVLLLEQRERQEDFDLILRQACDADWKTHPDPFARDWRETAVAVLSRHEATAPKAAEAFASLLRRKRSRFLAQQTARLIATYRRVEALPVLLRYSLEPYAIVNGSACADALEQLGLPHAGLPILMSAVACERPKSKPLDFAISAKTRSRMAALLGKDVGDSYLAWQQALGEALVEPSLLLPEPVQEEFDRELDCFVRFSTALNHWFEARGALMRRRLRAEGKMDKMRVAQEFAHKVGDQYVPDWALPTSVMSAGMDLEAVYNAATEEMRVERPDYDAPTVEDFEREVDAYVERVKAVIREEFPLTTRPAETEPSTQPASGPGL